MISSNNKNFLPILNKSPLYLWTPNKEGLYNNFPWLTKPTTYHRQLMWTWENSFRRIGRPTPPRHRSVAWIQQTGIPMRGRQGTPQILALLHIASVPVIVPAMKIKYGWQRYKAKTNLIKQSLVWRRIFQVKFKTTFCKISNNRHTSELPHKNPS